MLWFVLGDELWEEKYMQMQDAETRAQFSLRERLAVESLLKEYTELAAYTTAKGTTTRKCARHGLP